MSSSDDFFVAKGPAAVAFRADKLQNDAPVFDFGVKAVAQTTGVYGQVGGTAIVSSLQGGVVGTSLNFGGVIGWSRLSTGVEGGSFTGTGVLGASFYGVGVRGVSGAIGVRGSGQEIGVFGESEDGTAVFAFSGRSSPPRPVQLGPLNGSPAAVLARSQQFPGAIALSNSTFGVFGQCGLQGPAVPAPIDPIAGVCGSSAQHTGVVGSSNLIGVVGFSAGVNGVGVWGQAKAPGSFAGFFNGNVEINGDLTQSNGVVSATIKNAIVPFPDGSKRLLHCMESPEHWFEDFGTAKLKGGRAVVKLDADFAKTIKRGDYHVFLTPKGDCSGLFVRRQGGTSFEVRELQGGTSSVAFSYRIVGRRRDIKAHKRFAKVDLRPRLPAARPLAPRRPKAPRPPAPSLRAFVARVEKRARAEASAALRRANRASRSRAKK